MDYAVDRPLHKNSLMLLGFFRQPIRRYALRGQGGTRAEERLLPTASRKRRRDTIALSGKRLNGAYRGLRLARKAPPPGCRDNRHTSRKGLPLGHNGPGLLKFVAEADFPVCLRDIEDPMFV